MSNAKSISAYRFEGDRVIPTEHSRGPWFNDQQHGGCVFALLTRFMERVPSASPMRFARITADMSRPVPMEPMTLTARALRDGRRVQSLEATLSVDGSVIGRALGTRIRVEPGLVPANLLPPGRLEDEPPPFLDEETDYGMEGHTFHDCLEVHARQDADGLGSRAWIRMSQPLIEGESPSSIVRSAAIADFVSSSSWRLGEDWISINPEVSLQLEREPVGEWLCVESTIRFEDDGMGVSEAILFDRTHRIGRASKGVLNMRR
jgi:Acyl-CoA thioesterase N-terminal domain/Acyl-CoA thioesterase C-terminal domain